MHETSGSDVISREAVPTVGGGRRYSGSPNADWEILAQPKQQLGNQQNQVSEIDSERDKYIDDYMSG